MIISMTGYGRGEASVDGITAEADVRSVNGRYLEVRMNLPRSLQTQEHAIRELVRSRTGRGQIQVRVTLLRDGSEELGTAVDPAAARAAFAMLQTLRNEVGLREDITLAHLLAFPDVLRPPEQDGADAASWSAARAALETALDALNAMRRMEGGQLGTDLLARVAAMEAGLARVESLIKDTVEARRTRLTERIRSVVEEKTIDPQRMALEAALIADRLDITEECVRFRSHAAHFRELAAAAEPAGRKLNFLLQEMNREVNTIGSKAEDAEIARVVVTLKEELEKIREQVQNLE